MVIFAVSLGLTWGISTGPTQPGTHGNTGSTGLPAALSASASQCSGSVGPSVLSGNVTVVGGASPPNPAGLPVNYTGYVQKTTTSGGQMTLYCYQSTGGQTTTAAYQALVAKYNVTFTLPGNSCRNGICVSYTGPFSPDGVTVGNLPAGYLLSQSGSSFMLSYALSTTSLSSGSTLSLSAGDYSTVTATGLTGTGSSTPANPVQFSWSFLGAPHGWTIDGGTSYIGPEARLAASTGAGNATIAVNATGYYGGLTVSAQESILNVHALITSGGTLRPSKVVVDSGESLNLIATGITGAMGYTYNATFWPTGGGSSVTSLCTVVNFSIPSVTLSCTHNVTYSNAGRSPLKYDPVVEVSNGHSSTSVIASPENVTVYPAPALNVSDVAKDLYVNHTYAVTVSIVYGGAPPYLYCFYLGGSFLPTCSSWVVSTNHTFLLSYTLAGSYAAQFHVQDHTGENVSANTTYHAWPPFSVGSVGATATNLDLGNTDTAYLRISNGAPPFGLTWNDSTSGKGLCGYVIVTSYGNYSCTFSPSWSGTNVVTVVVRDALGTTGRSAISITVNEPPGSIIVSALAGTSTGSQSTPLSDEVGLKTYINTTFAGGTAPYQYQWMENGTVLVSGSGSVNWFNFTYAWSSSGKMNLYFSAKDAHGSLTTASLVVVVYPSLGNVGLSMSYDPVDVGVADNLTALLSGGVPPFTFSWSMGDGHGGTSTNLWYLYSWMSSANYTLSLTVTDGTGIKMTDAVRLHVSPPLTAPCGPHISPDPTEVSMRTLFNVACVVGGSGPFNYTWYYGDGAHPSMGGSAGQHVYSQAGSYGSYVTIGDSGGGFTTSQGTSVAVQPEVGILLPQAGQDGCPTHENVNPVDVGENEQFCTVIQGGVGTFTIAFTVDGLPITGSQYAFPTPGNHTVNVTVTDQLGAWASAHSTFLADPAPTILAHPSLTLVDANQSVRINVSTSGGIGLPGTWGYTWTLKGITIGTGRDINYSFKGAGNPCSFGICDFTVVAIDGSGVPARSDANVTVLADPLVKLNLTRSSIDMGSSDNASAFLSGGDAPFTYIWNIHTPSGWVNSTTSTGMMALPSSLQGTYSADLSVVDALNYRSNTVSDVYVVNGPLSTTLHSTTMGTGNATTLGELVIVELCLKDGGTGPYSVGFNMSGTSIVSWTQLRSGESCITRNATYSSTGEVWVAGAMHDALGEVSTDIISLMILEPATAPTLSRDTVTIEVHQSAYVHASDNGQYTMLTWRVQQPSNVTSVSFRNGTLMIEPLTVGTYGATAVAQVVYDGFNVGPVATVNLTIVATPGPAIVVYGLLSVQNATEIAGGSVSLTLSANDAWGNRATSFAENWTLFMAGALPTGSSGGPYINASGVKVLITGGGHSANIVGTDWKDGVVVLSVSQHRSGKVIYEVEGLGLPIDWIGTGTGGNFSLDWVPYTHDMVVYDPTTLFSNATVNDTVWHISDRFGNTIPQGNVVVQSTWGSFTETNKSPIFVVSGKSYTWVNYTVRGMVGGTVEVVSAEGQVLIPAIEIPPLDSHPSALNSCLGVACAFPGWLGTLLVLFVLAMSALLLYALFFRDRRDSCSSPDREDDDATDPDSPSEEDLVADAAIHDALVAKVDASGAATLKDLKDTARYIGLSYGELLFYLQRLTTEGILATRQGEEPENPIFVRNIVERACGKEEAGEGAPLESIEPVIDEKALEEAAIRQQKELGDP